MSRRRLSLSISTIRAFFASEKFWYAIVGIFLFNTLWIALMGIYPLVYDEAYHIGIIDVYSHQWLPFIQSQTENTASLGDITRYGSYLYHYLMSFPYRLLMNIGLDQSMTIIVLRLINIGIFVGIIYWMRKLLRVLGFSRPISQLSVFVITLLPMFPYLAATINYDSLFLLFAGVFLTLSVRFLKNKKPSLMDVSILLIVGCLGSVTKYTFLPIFAVSALVISFSVIRRREYFIGLVRSIDITKIQSSWKVIAASVLVIVSLGLFIERYAVNLAVYHQPEPSCTKTHSVEFCRHWAPWRLSYDMEQINKNPEDPTIKGMGEFIVLYWMRDIVINTSLMGGANSLNVASYWSLRILHLIVPFLFLFYILGIFHQKLRSIRWINLTFLLYIGVLITHNYLSFAKMGIPTAIQARYLAWFLPIIVAYALFIGIIFLRAVGQYNVRSIVIVGLISVVCGSQFAGNMTYWYRQTPLWVNGDGGVQQINQVAHDVVEKIVIGP